ncbi:MAG: HD domain-containing protein [Gemmatimonadetes bacterium]|nr:HD domain-containing protein [Gemmatimonadota bacterium]
MLKRRVLVVEPNGTMQAWIRAEGERAGLMLEAVDSHETAGIRLREDAPWHYVVSSDRDNARDKARDAAREKTEREAAPVSGACEDEPRYVPLALERCSPREKKLRLRLLFKGMQRHDSEARLERWGDAEFPLPAVRRQRELLRALRPAFREFAEKEETLHGHSYRVGFYAARIGESLTMSPRVVRLLFVGGWIHDLGKLRVDTRILTKRESLNEQEWKSIRQHPVWGEEIVEDHTDDRELLDMVRFHHERFDGRGYPDNLARESIPIAARILAVADAYDAMTSERTYCAKLSHREAVREVLSCTGSQFDPAIVRGFLNSRLDRALP